jgi:diguanylate cyclase (GGDEF)-like protein
VVAGVVWLFSFDLTSALWGLLVIPVLEAAVAAQMLGALGMWAGLTVFYVIREFETAARYEQAQFEVASLTFRMGIVLIVAATAGSLARNLTEEVRAQRRAREESQKRARLLHGLALSSQALLNVRSQTTCEDVWEAVVAAAVELGFDGASLMVVEQDASRFRIASGRNTPDGYVGSTEPIHVGVAGAVYASGEAVLVEDYSTWEQAVPAFHGTQFRSSIGVPIRRELDVEAVLVAAYHEVGPIPPPERECVELLAVHAGGALNNVAHFSERARYEEQLTRIAFTDTLTGLPNRDLFVRSLDASLAAGTPGMAVLFIDLDRFKTVNDSLGHHGGDELLVELAGRLVAAAEPHLVARFGGDEFTVLVEDVDGPKGARAVARDLMAALSTPLFIQGQEILPGTSVGIRCALPGETEGHLLLRDADTAMYRAKGLGRQRVEVYDPAESAGLPALTLETEMRRGLALGEFQLYYQPVHTMDGRVASVEALVRWDHPDRGQVSPADFMPLAEDSGLIVPLGRWVLNEACRQAARWRAIGCPLAVAANVSLVQLHDPGLVNDITEALEAADLPPSQLLLEITESATVTDPALMLAQALRIRDLGVRLALDDFGQGTTSLRFVRRLPLDVLKIDKSFIDDLGAARDGAPGQTAVVRSVIGLAHDLGMAVTAEGVEEERQMELLTELGCDHAQGFLLGRPMPADDITAVVQAARVLDELPA